MEEREGGKQPINNEANKEEEGKVKRVILNGKAENL